MNDQAPLPIQAPEPSAPPQIDTEQIMHWLNMAAWASAVASIVGVLAGLVMLAFGSRQAARMIVGGIAGTIVASVVATTVLPRLPGFAS